MATRYGGQVREWLIKRKWASASLDPSIIGDAAVIDPITKQEMDVYSAAKLQRERTGEYPEFLPEDW